MCLKTLRALKLYSMYSKNAINFIFKSFDYNFNCNKSKKTKSTIYLKKKYSTTI